MGTAIQTDWWVLSYITFFGVPQAGSLSALSTQNT